MQAKEMVSDYTYITRPWMFQRSHSNLFARGSARARIRGSLFASICDNSLTFPTEKFLKVAECIRSCTCVSVSVYRVTWVSLHFLSSTNSLINSVLIFPRDNSDFWIRNFKWKSFYTNYTCPFFLFVY